MKSNSVFSSQALSLKRRSSLAGHDHRFGFLTHEALGGALPQGHVVVPERHLRLYELDRIGHDPGRHLEEGIADMQRIGGSVRVAVGGLPRQKFSHQMLAVLGDPGHCPA